MRLYVISSLLVVLSAQVGVAASGPTPIPCDSVAAEAISEFQSGDADHHRLKFPDDIASKPPLLSTIMEVIFREYGAPTETTLDDDIDLEEFTNQGLISRKVEAPFKTYKYRTYFHREREGIVSIKIGLLENECRIAELSVGIPRSRPDALQRFWEISTQISSELAAASR